MDNISYPDLPEEVRGRLPSCTAPRDIIYVKVAGIVNYLNAANLGERRIVQRRRI